MVCLGQKSKVKLYGTPGPTHTHTQEEVERERDRERERKRGSIKKRESKKEEGMRL